MLTTSRARGLTYSLTDTIHTFLLIHGWRNFVPSFLYYSYNTRICVSFGDIQRCMSLLIFQLNFCSEEQTKRELNPCRIRNHNPTFFSVTEISSVFSCPVLATPEKEEEAVRQLIA